MTHMQPETEATVVPDIKFNPVIQEVYILLNPSGSNTRVEKLNEAMRECVDILRSSSGDYPRMDLRLSCIAVTQQPQWHIGPEPKQIHEVEWTPLPPSRMADAGAAINMLSEHFASRDLPRRCLPPVIVLVSDGKHSDCDSYAEAIKRLDETFYGSKSNRFVAYTTPFCDWLELEKFRNRHDVGALGLSWVSLLMHHLYGESFPIITDTPPRFEFNPFHLRISAPPASGGNDPVF